jgi:hypothetical protein
LRCCRGYRLIASARENGLRLFTLNGHDWTDRYPLIVEAALRNRATSFVIDGEADDLRQLPLSLRKAMPGRHLRFRFRAGRDRARPVPQGMRVRAWCQSTAIARTSRANRQTGSR